MDIRLLARQQINDMAWNACVASSLNQLLYGYSWYLDAVTSAPDWSWIGLVVMGPGSSYQAVMPVPLRRKRGIFVVHQPLFCQLLGVFSKEQIDSLLFFKAMQQRFRYGSILHVQQILDATSLRLQTRPLYTHTLNLLPGYEVIATKYSRDRRLNLRRAEAVNWQTANADDVEPLIKLFQENHADGIPNGVAPWAYVVLRSVMKNLQQRGLATLRYASLNGIVHAGALFVRNDNRIIYLFNAASEMGRRGNARTLLIDQIIRDNAGTNTIFDFESPEKPSIAQFYESFGAVAEPFWEVKYNRLTWVERWLQRSLSGRHPKKP